MAWRLHARSMSGTDGGDGEGEVDASSGLGSGVRDDKGPERERLPRALVRRCTSAMYMSNIKLVKREMYSW